MVAQVEARLGPVDILVNNAGIARPQALDEITEKDWDEVLDINLKSVFFVTQAVLGGMRKRKWGRIINLSSVAAQTGGAVGPHYAASRFATAATVSGLGGRNCLNHVVSPSGRYAPCLCFATMLSTSLGKSTTDAASCPANFSRSCPQTSCGVTV